MPAEEVQQLLEQARASGLLTAEQVRRVSSVLRAERAATADEAAARLVQEGVLTDFQAERLLAARGEDCVLAGRYQLLECLGAGGMGAVYKAQDCQLNRLVAVKLMAANLLSDAGAVARFQREARALALVSHPAIVQVYDAGQDKGRHYLVMEYVPGTSLAELLKEKGSIAPCRAAEYIHQAALGLQHAHDRGLVHRDLKPANLLLTPQQQVKILDLGLARFMQDQIGEGSLTREGRGMGTPDYMAPEQFSNARAVDARADIYSLGCTLYHFLAGQVPFPGSSFSEKARAHEEDEPPPLEERCAEAPAGLVLVVRRMMAKWPADRFQTAGELAEALALYVGTNSPVLPRLKTTVAWQGSQIAFTVPKRRPQAVHWAAAGAAVTVALVLLALFLFPMLRRLLWDGDSDQRRFPAGLQNPVEPRETAELKKARAALEAYLQACNTFGMRSRGAQARLSKSLRLEQERGFQTAGFGSYSITKEAMAPDRMDEALFEGTVAASSIGFWSPHESRGETRDPRKPLLFSVRMIKDQTSGEWQVDMVQFAEKD
jgi:serine/threonine protein kinase